jgi:hypothetical protein
MYVSQLIFRHCSQVIQGMIFQVLLQISFDGLPNLIYPIESYRVAQVEKCGIVDAPHFTYRIITLKKRYLFITQMFPDLYWSYVHFTADHQNNLYVLQQWGKCTLDIKCGKSQCIFLLRHLLPHPTPIQNMRPTVIMKI